VCNFAVSLDGFGAGLNQTVEDPLGARGEELHLWMFSAERTAIDDDFLRRGIDGIGATVMGRNMFGPVRGPWPDESWRGWWGEDPPYHHDVFVLTHHERASCSMDGGTTFHFVTEGVEAAVARAFAAADGRDVRLSGGASTVQQCLRLGLVDEVHLAVVPITLGGGERLLDGSDGVSLDGFTCTELVSSGTAVTHVVLTKDA
jgi:dihydrofolate reductase